ncbi:MAG: amidohydrolase [Theionarchaea archaeon]|nr:amidohydrolase [Theionarchaea archaeon]
MLIKNGWVLTTRLEKKDVAVDGTTITEVGTSLSGSDVIDASNHLVLPGLVNTHTHLAMTLLRGYADDVPLTEWLRDYIWPREMNLTPEDCYYGNLLGSVEMIKSGTTCFHDMYFYPDQAVKAVKESGMRAVISYPLAEFGNPERAGHMLQAGLQFMDTLRTESRIDTSFGPHSPSTCSPEYLLKVQDHAQKLSKLVHIHLHESKDWVENFSKAHEKPPIEFLESSGFLKNNVCAAHVVHATDKELDILKTHGVKVLHCPSSNLKLANGIAPVASMIKKGICVALGTDGAASNNTLDLFAEMRLMTLLQKLNDPSAMTSRAAVKIATENGGTALKWKIGRIEEGFLADIILIDLRNPCMTPRHDVLSNVVYAANSSAVDTVIIDGEVIMENRVLKTLHEEDIVEKAREHAYDLVNR